MTLKTFKPYTKSTRGTVLIDKSGLWKGKPYKPLTSVNRSSKGRNNLGRITQENTVVVINTSIELLIFIEVKLVLRVWLKELNMTLIDLVT